MQQQAGLRGFVQQPLGRVLLIAFAIVVTALTYAYLYALLAIPVMLLVGLAVPIWLGIKRIRFLALLGLVVLLISAPIANVVLTQEVMQPIGAASSPADLVGGGGGAIMQNAQVSPYVGGLSTNFTWNVQIVPQYIPKGNDTPFLLTLYISTCPGATGTNDPNCGAGYPFYELNRTFSPANFTNVTDLPVTFHFIFPSDSIWAWQMGLFLNNSTSPSTHNATFILLVGDPTYNGLEGPVVGTFATTYAQLLLTVYLNILVYLGVPFYVVACWSTCTSSEDRSSGEARSPGRLGLWPPNRVAPMRPFHRRVLPPRRELRTRPGHDAPRFPAPIAGRSCIRTKRRAGSAGSSSLPLPRPPPMPRSPPTRQSSP